MNQQSAGGAAPDVENLSEGGPALPQRDASGNREYVHRDACLMASVPESLDVVESTPPAEPTQIVGDAGRTEAAAAALDGLDEEQREAVLAPLGPVRIRAGTGKTRSITHRIAYYHHRGEAPASQVLAVTHSRRAAAEMRERLERLAVMRATAATFHAAARRQLITHWDHTGLPGDKLQQLDTRDRFGMLRQVLGTVLGRPPGQIAADQVRDLGLELHKQLALPQQVEQHRQHRDRITRRTRPGVQSNRRRKHLAKHPGDLGDVMARMPITGQPPHVGRRDRLCSTDQLVLPLDPRAVRGRRLELRHVPRGAMIDRAAIHHQG